MASCDPAPVLQPAENDLDAVAAAIAPLVVADGFAARLPSGDAAACPNVFQRFPESAGAIAPVSDHPVGGRQTAQQGGGATVVADLAPGHEELKQTTLGSLFILKMRWSG